MRKLALLSFIVALSCASTSYASSLMDEALKFVPSIEKAGRTPIAILARKDKTEDFWVNASSVFCQKLSGHWCAKPNMVWHMNSNTEPSGQSNIIQYRDAATDKVAVVCGLIPPVPTIYPGYVAEAFGTFTASEFPTADEMAAWLILYHSAHCLDNTQTVNPEARAAAFATLGLALLKGDPIFTTGQKRSGARIQSTITKMDAAYWAAGISERILLDHWKVTAAEVLGKQYNCHASVLKSTSIDIEKIQRATELTPGKNCQGSDVGGQGVAEITDANLWIWLYGAGGLGAPPKPYTAFAPIGGPTEMAAAYLLEASASVSKSK